VLRSDGVRSSANVLPSCSAPPRLNGAQRDIILAGDLQRLDIALRVIAERKPDEQPVDLLMRLTEEIMGSFAPAHGDTDEITGIPYSLRVSLVLSVPELHARALRNFHDAQLRLADALHNAYPDEIDWITAASMIGAVLGAAQMARRASLEAGDPAERVVAATRQGIDIAMRGVIAAAKADFG
jgi:hypothetical protein